MDELTTVFVTESREQLAAMEEALLQLEANPEDSDLINAVFRPAHTIKGGAGVIECNFIVAFTHVAENALDKLRNGDIKVSSDLVAVLLGCCDHIGNLLSVLEAGAAEPDEDLRAEGDSLLSRLQRDWLDAKEEAPAASVQPNRPPVEKVDDVQASGGGLVETDFWHISLRFGAGVLRNGMDPISFLRYLSTLGQIVHIETIPDAMPSAEEMDPEACYLGFEIKFKSDADKAAIEAVFDFVRDECTLHILPPNSKLADYIALLQALPENTMRLGEILVKIGALTQAELDDGLKQQHAVPPEEGGEEASPPPPLGEILIEQKVVQPELVEAAVIKQKQVSEKKAAEARLIRIQADKLDRLIDLVGELVIAGASTNLLASRAGLSDLNEATSLLNRLVEQIRDSALQLRMVQIGETFNRFQRVVRDVSKELGKDIELTIAGGETELDKSVVEKIGDPLMHLVRNAMDHGIESAEVRQAKGKSPRGRLSLNAYHDSGSIVIDVADDGGGLNRDKILKKAVEKGLVQAGVHLSDQEIANLIFEPGFSTVDKVSNLSGRGVGMDVVKRNIQGLRGRVEVHSEEGHGTRFSIRLPLTLAIIDGFLVGADRASYVIPLDMVVECLELQAHATSSGDRNYLNLRGEVLPFIRLRDLFEIPGEPPKRENVVVVKAAGQKAGIVVDTLLGEFQTVIKPLGQLFRHLRGIGGSTILGSGDVALILDVQALAQIAIGREERSLAAPSSVNTPRISQV